MHQDATHFNTKAALPNRTQVTQPELYSELLLRKYLPISPEMQIHSECVTQSQTLPVALAVCTSLGAPSRRVYDSSAIEGQGPACAWLWGGLLVAPQLAEVSCW